MQEARRKFVWAAAASCASMAAGARPLLAQWPIKPPPPPAPADTHLPVNGGAGLPGVAAARRAALLKDEKEFRDGVERLYQLTGELRETLQKTMTTEIFSISMVKKTGEIEKLAKFLKNKARSA